MLGDPRALSETSCREAGLSDHDLWVRYFELGGMATVEQIVGFVRDGAEAPREHDLLAHALNERFAELGLGRRVYYNDERTTPSALEAPGGALSVYLEGELDIATGPIVREQLARAQAVAPEGLVVDLRDVTFMDASGLRVLLQAALRAKDMGHGFVLAKARPNVRAVLDLTQTAWMHS